MVHEWVRFELPIKPGSVRWACNLVAGFRDYLDQTTYVDLRLMLRLMVSELVADAVRAGAHGRDGIALRVEVHDDDLEAVVVDGGAAYELRAREPEAGELGWGIHSVRLLADRWAVRHDRDGSSVWLRVQRSDA